MERVRRLRARVCARSSLDGAGRKPGVRKRGPRPRQGFHAQPQIAAVERREASALRKARTHAGRHGNEIERLPALRPPHC
jgi:hypothetical protein